MLWSSVDWPLLTFLKMASLGAQEAHHVHLTGPDSLPDAGSGGLSSKKLAPMAAELEGCHVYVI